MSDKCECVPCDFCKGTGNVWRTIVGGELRKYKLDDLDELEVCPDCDGEGVVDACAYCLDQEDR